MVSLTPNSPSPGPDPQALRLLAEKLAEAAMLAGGFDPPLEHLIDPPPAPRFELGKTYTTSAVIRWAKENGIDLGDLLTRHRRGDWGDLDEGDKAANEQALEAEARILSCYMVGDRKIYVITEADRSMTTVLFASEY